MQRNNFFIYTTKAVTVGATTTTTATIAIGNHRFFVDKVTGCTTTPANITLLITVSNMNQDLSNGVLPWADIIGTAQRPSIIPSGTLVFDAGQDIEISITNSGAAQTTYINFIGYKIRQ